MATRLDELHGQQYTTRRVVNALTRHDADPTRPYPKSMVLVLVGAVIAALLAVGALVINLITGQGTPAELRDSSVVLLEKESGAMFVYTKTDDQLHPVLNLTSGLLITDGNGSPPILVRRSHLTSLRRDAGVQIGTTLGIPKAPNALPRVDDLVNGAWTVCSRSSAENSPETDLLVAAPVTGGHVLARPGGSTAGEALLVQAPDGRSYLIFGDRKFLLSNPAVVTAAFGWTGRPPQPVSAALLNALPSGPDIVTPAIAGAGQSSRVIDDTIGRVYQAPGPTGDQWAVVLRDKVQPLTDVQARLLQADPRSDARPPVKVTIADFVKLLPPGASNFGPAPGGQPAAVPTLLTVASSACVSIANATAGATSVVTDPDPVAMPAQAKGGSAQVSVPFGHGVLVRAAASPSGPPDSGTVSVITDEGIQYPVADKTALARLGYGNVTPLAMPATLVSLLPAGPSLTTTTFTQNK